MDLIEEELKNFNKEIVSFVEVYADISALVLKRNKRKSFQKLIAREQQEEAKLVKLYKKKFSDFPSDRRELAEKLGNI